MMIGHDPQARWIAERTEMRRQRRALEAQRALTVNLLSPILDSSGGGIAPGALPTDVARGYSTVIGDGTTTSFTIAHGLASRAVEVQCFLVDAPYELQQGGGSADQVVLTLTNKSGADVDLGDVVLVDVGGSHPDAFITQNFGQAGWRFSVVGVATATIANNATGPICIMGRVEQVNLDASSSGYDYLYISATDKLAAPSNLIRPGVVGYTLGTGSSPAAVLWGWPEQGSNGQLTISCYNGTGADIDAGDVVVQDIAFTGAVKTTTTAGLVGQLVGVAIEPLLDGYEGMVCFGGLVEQINLDSAGGTGKFLITSATAGQATPVDAPMGPGSFGQMIASSRAIIWNPPIVLPTPTTTGDLFYYDGAAWVLLPAGTDGQVLTLAGGVPTWA